MPRQTDYSAVVDGILRLIAVGGITFTALAAPNAIQMLDKPLKKYFSALDKRSRQREFRRLMRYVREKKLISENYEYGLELTDKARKRLAKADFDQLEIVADGQWDGLWRIVFYDVPETKRHSRNALAFKLRQLGFYQLQRSVWIHPYPCHDVVKAVAHSYQVDKYITYIEATRIANQEALIRKFPSLSLV